jgi:hypothetical protein
MDDHAVLQQLVDNESKLYDGRYISISRFTKLTDDIDLSSYIYIILSTNLKELQFYFGFKNIRN